MATSSHSSPETGYYFPCPAGVNVADHVTLKLSPTNYFAWEQLMVAFLRNQQLLGFVDGNISPMNKPPTPHEGESSIWEDKCSNAIKQQESTAEMKRRQDWKHKLQLDSDQMPAEAEPLLNCLEEWKQEQDGVEEWEKNRKDEWKAEQVLREADWTSEREKAQEWVQKLREMMKQQAPAEESTMEIIDQKRREKGKQLVLDESQKENWKEYYSDDQEEERRHEKRRRSWEQLQEKKLRIEQERREEWKREWDEKWKEIIVEAKELGEKLDLEANGRNEWHRKQERRQKENWGRRNEWERGEKRRLLVREEERKYEEWKRLDGLVMGWIQAMVTEEMLVQVIHLKTAREVWIKLRKIFIPPFSVPSSAELIDWTDQRTAENVRKYMKLHKATLTADWEAAKKFLYTEPDSVLQPITWSLETALMVAIRSDKRKDFTEHLITRMVIEKKMMVLEREMKERIQQMVRNWREIMKGMEGTEREMMEKMVQEVREMMEQRREWIENMEPIIESMERMQRMEREMIDCINREMTNTTDGMEPEGLMTVCNEIRGQSVPLLGETDISGATALHAAVERGNIDTAELLIDKNPQLVNIGDNYGTLPVHVAARLGNGEMVEFLRPRTTNLCENESGHKLLHFLASGGLYDIASKFLEAKPWLACMEPSPLVVMAQKRTSFHNSETTLSIIQRLINSVPVPQWCIQETKSTHHQALKLVKRLCDEVVKNDLPNAAKIFKEPLMKATSLGIHEIVEEILESFPSAIHLRNEMNQSIFHLAIVYRREKVFNLIYQMEVDQRALLSMPDASTNNALHLAGNLTPQQQLLLRANAAGAALQMQRELQWFKEVENYVLPHVRDDMNAAGKTPQEVFTEKHQDLVKEGEKWMKDTATSCSIVAVLITTIVFAAAITVPGGSYNDSNVPNTHRGLPIRLGQRAFTLFGVFNAVALFSSTTSLLIFLSILTSRYGEQDFLHALPNRMIIGLVTLFLSILSMMIAFAVTLKIVFGERTAWLVIPVGFLSLVPITMFATLQYRLLSDMIRSTYCQGIFRKQSSRIL